MKSDDIIFVLVLTSVIWAFVIYYIISAATRSKNIAKLNVMQVKLLREIALKSGVESEKVEKITGKAA